MPRRMARLLLPLLAALALLAGCGSDDERSSSKTTRSSAAAPPAQGSLENTSVKPEIPKPTGTPPRRLVKEDIVKGKGPAAKAGDTVVVNYVGVNFSNGHEFDASWDTGQPFPVQLGTGSVIKGWDQGLVGIKAGGRRMLTIPPELGYGAEGFPPDIPPNETLVFVVDAVSIN
jgi:peptidylprolyl isomerase